MVALDASLTNLVPNTSLLKRLHNSLIHYDKGLLSFQVGTYKIAKDSYENFMSLYVNTSTEMPSFSCSVELFRFHCSKKT